jgi:hypothetical protein
MIRKKLSDLFGSGVIPKGFSGVGGHGVGGGVGAGVGGGVGGAGVG